MIELERIIRAMSIWESHDLSQWEPLAIKAVTPDGNLFRRRQQQGKSQEDKSDEDDSKDKNNEEESKEFELILNDETVLFENEDDIEKPPILIDPHNVAQEESEEVVKRVWLEALGSALFKVSGMATTVTGVFMFPDISDNFLHAMKLQEPHMGNNAAVFPWLLTFPGGSLFSERIL